MKHASAETFLNWPKIFWKRKKQVVTNSRNTHKEQKNFSLIEEKKT